MNRGPEFIRELGVTLEIDMASDYKKASKYYKVFFEIPVEQAIFDGWDSLEENGYGLSWNDETMIAFLQKTLEFLAIHYKGALWKYQSYGC